MKAVRFDERVAIVTGAGRGLGRAYALLLASRGARVVVNDLGGTADGDGASSEPATTVVQEILERGGVAVADTHTVTTADGAEAIVKTALGAFGRVDALIHNAGIVIGGAIENMAAEKLDPVLDVHLRGAFFVIKAAWQVMQARCYGRVLNVISNAGLFGLPGFSAYAGAKGGLVGLTRSLALEGARHNIKVNAVAPAAYTRLTADIPDARIRRWFETRFQPEWVAPIVAWLVHEDCAVTGEIYSAGAGRVARVFIGETPGYTSQPLTLEDVRDHFQQIRAADGYVEPLSSLDEMSAYMRAIGYE